MIEEVFTITLTEDEKRILARVVSATWWRADRDRKLVTPGSSMERSLLEEQQLLEAIEDKLRHKVLGDV